VYARRNEELGRLALLCYCEVRAWARRAHEEQLAELAWALCAQSVPSSRSAFLGQVDTVIDELEHVCQRANIPATATELRRARHVGAA
jgi:hypothetical protein